MQTRSLSYKRTNKKRKRENVNRPLKKFPIKETEEKKKIKFSSSFFFVITFEKEKSIEIAH